MNFSYLLTTALRFNSANNQAALLPLYQLIIFRNNKPAKLMLYFNKLAYNYKKQPYTHILECAWPA